MPDEEKQYQIRATNPGATDPLQTTTTTPLSMNEALHHAVIMRNSGHTDIVLIDLDTGAKIPLEQVMKPKDAADAQGT